MEMIVTLMYATHAQHDPPEVRVTTTAAPVPAMAVLRRRAATTLTRATVRAVAIAQRGAASTIGAAGLTATAVGAGAQWGWPVGLMVGGPLAVWFASLLPGGDG